MDIDALETPCLILDENRMMSNVERMRARLSERNIDLRPHLKTAKCAEIAQRLVAGQSGSICVSTLQEAEFFAARGYLDQIYAVAIAANKLRHIERLMKHGAQICVLIDDHAALDAVETLAHADGTRFPVLLEIDSDGHRSGLAPSSPQLVPLASAVARSTGATFKGVLTHAGGSYASRSVDDIKAFAAAERNAVLEAARALRAAGLECEIVSLGSTPTVTFGEDFSGITEVRAGVFVFQDLVMANLGVCGIEDIALSVLTTVIGHRRSRGQLITDSGWTSLSSDLGTATQAVDYRYGLVCDQEGRVLAPELRVVNVNQEHGIIEARSEALDFARFQLGTKLRVLPVHACAMAAGHRCYQVTRDNRRVDAVWQRIK